MNKTLRRQMFGAVAALAMGGAASAAVIGPGTGIGETVGSLDTTGTRTNVDLVDPVTLPAGLYTASLFNFTAGGNGDVQPFLAVPNTTINGTGTDSFTIIAVGSDKTITGVSSSTAESLPFGGTAGGAFALATTTTVYAGITNQTGPNPVEFADPGPGASVARNDHNNPGSNSYAIGTTISGFSNPGLPRSYAFSITVNAVPEPASLGLLGAGAVGLLGRRRRA